MPRPPYGVLQYADLTFAVPYTRDWRKSCGAPWRRSNGSGRALDRSHHSPERSACGSDVCDQALD
jgi:hypothetical protein